MPVSSEIETLAYGMMANQMRQDVISNNMANVNTVGYKKDLSVDMSFAETLENATQRSSRAVMDLDYEMYHTQFPGVDSHAFTHEVSTSYSQGDLRLTGNDLDIAIAGKGYLAVATQNGTRYTRDGSLMLNSNNELVNKNGERILGMGGEKNQGAPIVINGSSVAILSDGSVQVDGVNAGKLMLVDFNDYSDLFKQGASQFDYRGSQDGITQINEASVEQGYLEGANVNSLTEITSMISNTRQYEIAGKSLKTVEQTLSRAIVDLPKFK